MTSSPAPSSRVPPGPRAPLPVVRLQVHTRAGQPTVYEVGDGGFLIGSVAGCDLRLPGSQQAPVICLISRNASGACLRRLAPVQEVRVNGQPAAAAFLADGDRVDLGTAEVLVSVQGSPADAADADPHPVEQLERVRQQIEADCRRKVEILEERAHALQQRERELAGVRLELESRQQELRQTQKQAAEALDEMASRQADLGRKHEELQGLRQELDGIRQQLLQRYQERRDRLASRQHSLRRAARRLRLRTEQQDARDQELAQRQQEADDRTLLMEARAEELGRERQLLEDQQRLLLSRTQEVQRELTDRLSQIEERERALAQDRQAFETSQQEHRADLLRLDRLQERLDQRGKQLEERALDVDRRFEQLQRDTRELEEQAAQIDDWHQKVRADREQLERERREHQEQVGAFQGRAAALEGQQAMLATLRTRLERLREELRQQEQDLGAQRARQEGIEEDLRQRQQDAARLRQEAESDRQLFEAERKRFEEQRGALQEAVARLREARDRLTEEEEQLQARRQEVEDAAREHAEQTALLTGRATQVEETGRQLAADQQALAERQAALARSEEMLQTLQEQLRRRSDDLRDRQLAVAEQEKKLQELQAELDRRALLIQQDEQASQDRLDGLEEELARRKNELLEREQALARQGGEVAALRQGIEEGQARLEQARQELEARLAGFEEQRLALEAELAARRDGLEAAREEAGLLVGQLPGLADRAQTCLDRTLRAREQLRQHLEELHGYARQSRDDAERGWADLRAEADRLRRAEQAVQAARDEHRLAVAAFRQQVSEWQGQIGDMKQALLRGEHQLSDAQGQLNEKAQELADTSARLAREAEQLEQQKRLVAVHHDEVHRHLRDMQEWYRRKLRELVSSSVGRHPGAGASGPAAGAAEDPAAGEEGVILPMTGDAEPADRQLGDLLRSLELVDAETLDVLLLQARRQRRSLRQLLLAGGYLTLYQIALIEAGSLDALAFGPLRVIDRLLVGPREVRYRVFDPRRGQEALLRCLAEEEMHDAIHPDEFRQRFAALAALKHPHLAATYEVLELAGRPAALQEWLLGAPSSDWPSLASAPGVLFRLLSQAALSLQKVHEAGLTHGQLEASSLVLTEAGLLKLVGAGEPLWLGGDGAAEASVEADLEALGGVVAGWLASPGKPARARALPEDFAALLERLTTRPGSFASAAELLEALDAAGGSVPANAAAWDRFLRQVRQQLDEQVQLRQTA